MGTIGPLLVGVLLDCIVAQSTTLQYNPSTSFQYNNGQYNSGQFSPFGASQPFSTSDPRFASSPGGRTVTNDPSYNDYYGILGSQNTGSVSLDPLAGLPRQQQQTPSTLNYDPITGRPIIRFDTGTAAGGNYGPTNGLQVNLQADYGNINRGNYFPTAGTGLPYNPAATGLPYNPAATGLSYNPAATGPPYNPGFRTVPDVSGTNDSYPVGFNDPFYDPPEGSDAAGNSNTNGTRGGAVGGGSVAGGGGLGLNSQGYFPGFSRPVGTGPAGYPLGGGLPSGFFPTQTGFPANRNPFGQNNNGQLPFSQNYNGLLPFGQNTNGLLPLGQNPYGDGSLLPFGQNQYGPNGGGFLSINQNQYGSVGGQVPPGFASNQNRGLLPTANQNPGNFAGQQLPTLSYQPNSQQFGSNTPSPFQFGATTPSPFLPGRSATPTPSSSSSSFLPSNPSTYLPSSPSFPLNGQSFSSSSSSSPYLPANPTSSPYLPSSASSYFPSSSSASPYFPSSSSPYLPTSPSSSPYLPTSSSSSYLPTNGRLLSTSRQAGQQLPGFAYLKSGGADRQLQGSILALATLLFTHANRFISL